MSSISTPEPQTLNMIKMQKNFTAVNQKHKTAYPYKEYTIQFLLKRLKQEIAELEESINTQDWDNSQRECADVSNFTDYLFEAVTIKKQEPKVSECLTNCASNNNGKCTQLAIKICSISNCNKKTLRSSHP
jgi:NTP pyrophosphatase (non-canonical NTP hydrolase)